MLHFMAAGNFHDVKSAHHIGIDISARVFKAVAHTGLCGQMHNHIRRECIGDLIQPGMIFQHHFMRHKSGVLQQHLMALLFQRDVVIVGHPVHAADLKPVAQQQLCQMEADKPSRPGQKHFRHDNSVTSMPLHG